jgi:hypothetical protein
LVLSFGASLIEDLCTRTNRRFLTVGPSFSFLSPQFLTPEVPVLSLCRSRGKTTSSLQGRMTVRSRETTEKDTQGEEDGEGDTLTRQQERHSVQAASARLQSKSKESSRRNWINFLSKYLLQRSSYTEIISIENECHMASGFRRDIKILCTCRFILKRKISLPHFLMKVCAYVPLHSPRVWP